MKGVLFFIVFIILFFSCKKYEEESIIASNDMIIDIFDDKNNILEYIYEPVVDVKYIFLSIYNDSGISFFENPTQYYDDEFFDKYIEIKNSLGKLLHYEITYISYVYEMLPLYEYGYRHIIYIYLKCYYDNVITKESIVGTYIKEINKTKIISYFIQALNE